MEAACQLHGGYALNRMTWLFCIRNVLKHIRIDSGPKLIAAEVRELLKKIWRNALFIGPGRPRENDDIKRFTAICATS
jgi:hypothetical protein